MRSEKREASFPILIILEDKLASSTSAHDMIDVRFADPSCSPHSSPHPRVLAHDYTTRATSERIHFYIRREQYLRPSVQSFVRREQYLRPSVQFVPLFSSVLRREQYLRPSVQSLSGWTGREQYLRPSVQFGSQQDGLRIRIDNSSIILIPAKAQGQLPHPAQGRCSCSAPRRRRHPCPGCRRGPSRTSGDRCRRR